MRKAETGGDAATLGGRGLSLSAWSIAAAFGAYFCMYAFRKPFTAGEYAGDSFFGLSRYPILITAQVLGYTLSKFLGIKVIAEVAPRRRAALMIGLVAAAEFSLLLFGLTPAPWNAIWLFGNGAALGMVFGLVLGFLEGRRHTEALISGLCTSFIVADGVTRSVGAHLLKAGVSESWMPFTAGLLFAPPFLLFTWMLTRIPSPSSQDIAARSERVPMNSAERWGFFQRYAVGLTLLVLVYLLVTILRSVRGDFSRQIWDDLGVAVQPAVFAWSEIAVAAGVLILNGSAVLIRDNRRGFFFGLALAIGGPGVVGIALIGHQTDSLSPFAFMVLHGLGLYLPYIAVHTTIFERLIAMTRDRGAIGYLMYLADAFGYLGYVVVLLARNLIGPTEDFLDFFLTLSWIIAGACVVLLIPCWRYFANHDAARPAMVEPRLKEAVSMKSDRAF